MKKLIVVLAAMSAAGAASAVTFDGTYVSGQKSHFTIGDGSSTQMIGVGKLIYDPASYTGTDYTRIYALDTTEWPGHANVFTVDPSAQAMAQRIVTPQFFKARNMGLDSNGDLYVSQPWDGRGSTGAVFKVTDPLGTPTRTTSLIKHQGTSGDDDVYNLQMVPTGFGGGYATGSDVVLYDIDYNSTTVEGLSVMYADSTGAVPHEDYLVGGSSVQDSWIAGSDVEGKIYSFHSGGIDHADLDGTDRAFVTRIASDGTLERVFLDTDVSALGLIDAGLEVNQTDGSLWMIMNNGGTRNVFRVDVANAAATNSDYFASASMVINDLGFDPGINGIGISPDGKQLALGAPGGTDSLYIYNIIPEPATIGLFGFLGVAMLWIRRRFAV